MAYREGKDRPTLWGLAKRLGDSSLVRICAIPLWSRDPFRANFRPVEDAILYRSATRACTEREAKARERVEGGALRIMTWNIKYGGGRIDFFYDGHGDRILMKASEVLTHLEALARVIEAVDPDVLCIQEIDRNAHRSAMIDQIRWLLDHTHLCHAAYASQWRADLVPSKSLGRVDGGVAILSRFPVQQAKRVALPLIDDQDSLTQYFFLRRCVLTTRIALPGRQDGVRVLCTHTSAFTAGQSKRAQISWLEAMMNRLDAGEDAPLILGGDLNVLPPGASQVCDFADLGEVDESFRAAATYEGQGEWLRPMYERYHPAVELDQYLANEQAFFSHSTVSSAFWTRKLDYLFANRTWRAGSVQTLQSPEHGGFDTMSCSDHAPLVGEVMLDEKKERNG